MTNPKQHFIELDGLRGIAALSVLLFHQRSLLGGQSFFGHAYLAVDFFFLLSGFVLEHAYGSRLAQGGSISAFIRDRVIRLHPLIILGTLLGALALTLNNSNPSPSMLLMRTAVSIVPMPGPSKCGGFGCLVDSPLWSLSMELVANIVFAVIARWLTNRILTLIIIICASIMIWMSFTTGDFDVGIHHLGTLRSILRVGASFFLGVLIYRVNQRRSRSLPTRRFWITPVLVVSFALLPYHDPASWYYDPITVLVIYPLLVLAAARSAPISTIAARWSGEISYPLYVLHVPLLLLLELAIKKTGNSLTFITSAICMTITITLSIVAARLYDEPVRSVLRRHFGSRNHRRPVQSGTSL